MLRAPVALGGVFLCVAFQSVWAEPANTRLCLEELPLRIQEIKKSAPVQTWSDSSLYTPTADNYTNCPFATLQCFAAEMEVLTAEWGITDVRLRLSDPLKKVIKVFKKPDPFCLRCELLQEENGKTFLDQLLNVVHKMNSQFCHQETHADVTTGQRRAKTRSSTRTSNAA